MDRVKGADGHTRWILGPVEMSIVAAIPTMLLLVLGYQVNSFASTQKEQGDQLAKVLTQQAVASAQLTTLQAQLADVPGLTRQLAEVKVQVERNTEDITELRGMKGLK